MSSYQYSVEFDGSHYLVLKSGRVVGAFSSAEEAYEAKRSFTGKKEVEAWQKIPPSVRLAKQAFAFA